MKPIAWVGDSRERLRELPADAMRDAGYQLELVQFPEAVYVLHVFQKKSRKTSHGDITVARRRLRAVLATRRQA